MRGFFKRFIQLPESPMRLLASWFFACSLFQLLRTVVIVPSWAFVVGTVLLFGLLTLAQHLLPFPRFTTLMLAVSAVGYALSLIGTNVKKDNLALYAVILFAVGIVLYPLLKREKHALLPFAVSKKRCIALCIAAAVGFFVILAGITCFRYLTFSSPNYDFGIFCNMFHNMSTTGLPIVSCERETIISHFAVHISPIYYVILPFYMLIPSPITLQVAQALVLASGIIPLYKLARHYKLSYAVTAALAALYALYPALSTGCFYDLHENCFLPPLLLWLFVCYEEKRYGWMVLPAVLILSVKEDAAVYLVFFGLYLLANRRDIRRGIPLIAVALVYFFTAVWILQRFGTGAMLGRYENLLNSNKETGGLLGTLLRDPGYFLQQITAKDHISKKLIWLFEMAVPLGALLWTPRRKYSRLLLLLPLLLNLLTQYGYQFNINYQYSFGTIPFLFYLLVQNAADSPSRPRREHLAFSVVSAGLLYAMLVAPQLGHYVGGYIRQYDTFTKMEQVLDTVPDNVSVTTTTVLLPHLAQRAVVYEDFYRETIDTDYVVLDMRPAFLKQSTKYYVDCLENGYTVVTDVEDLVVVLKAPEK